MANRKHAASTGAVGFLLALFWLQSAFAQSADLGIQAPGAQASPDEIALIFAKADALERSVFDVDTAQLESSYVVDRFSRAGLLFERVAVLEDGQGPAYWRASRATWLAGESLPLDDEAGRIEGFENALTLADQGLAANPECAECMLWKFIAMGRLRTTRGMIGGMRQVPEMAKLLDRALELEPKHRDSEDNSSLGNLHYSSAIFYRLVPDWFWMRWVLGVRGDKERALDHARTALALHPNRLDYQIEVGTQLLCLGTDRGNDEYLDAGRAEIERAILRAPSTTDERREIYFAKLMLQEPERACGYTGDKLMEIDEEALKKSSRE